MTTKVRSSTIYLPIVDDNSNNGTAFVNFTYANTGNLGAIYTSSSELTYNPSSGTLSATVMSSTSDERLKDNIVTITGALEKVDQLRGVTFTWKNNGLNSMGLVAQETEVVLPDAVIIKDDGIKTINYDSIIGVLVEAIKELKSEVEELKKEAK